MVRFADGLGPEAEAVSVAARLGDPPTHPAFKPDPPKRLRKLRRFSESQWDFWGPRPRPISRDDYLDLLRLTGDDGLRGEDLPSYRSMRCRLYDECQDLILRHYPRAPGWTCYGCLNLPPTVWIFEPIGPTTKELNRMRHSEPGKLVHFSGRGLP